MALLLVLVSLIASSAADGYERERPSTQDGGGGPNPESSPQSSLEATPSPPPAAPSPSPVAYYGPTAAPVVLPDGHIADTAAVAAARAAHLAALDKAKALWYGAGGRDDGSYDPYKYGDYAYNYNSLLTNVLSGQLGAINPNLIPTYLQSLGSRPYYGPMDVNLGIPKGYVAEAKAAEMARDAQLRALERARINAFLNANIFPHAGYYPTYFQSVLNATKANPLATLLGYSGIQGPLNRPYFGPLATPTVLPTGYLADTPEVAAARAAHLATLLKAKALWDAKGAKDTLRYGQYDQQLYNILQNYNRGSFFNPAGVPKDLEVLLKGSLNTPFGEYLAIAALLPPGYLGNTPLARAAQISALARTAAEASLWKSHHLYKRSN